MPVTVYGWGKGDSGGPAWVTSAVTGKPVQAGVLSSGVFPASKPEGETSYMHLARFRDWIRTHAGV
ncbi:hypothetical protein NLX83_40565 [Allokutzneria sp. A3M-2-11 16]|uniref:hypothetical protein n=1 Tax=Allokutzneria sp. A3M-2-11 16 TaxID=2962043 RepID=UPI0020B834D2|nr:hypothetical protein [Allokutzneria sp. A3M-2-11 16]MCP3805576.1 hypothetical protein [Allokutzneria sp. A3M-2-11 16]